MAILEQTVMEGTGMVKEIEESAISLVLQNLQQDQYQYPEKSFIREIASNAVDAIEEKKQAKSILLGETKVTDHYSSEENDFTKDSKFDPEYYDLKFLDPEDKISIVYLNRDRSFSNRDQITITDTGVGLGGNRLKGFFRPAFSTKRLNRKALGKFGIGSKSGLATGIESYQIMSRHNGREYYFDIYGDRFFSIVSRFNDKGFENPHEVWKAKRYNDEGDVEEFDNIIYYTETELPNCVSVMMDIKNPIRNKSKYIDAVKSQLTYFKYVTLHEVYEDKNNSWRDREIHFKTDVLYQDEYLIIPEDNYYSVPHLILNGVNYGRIDFAEAEMDEKKGNIGIIGDPSEIDVNQSRESVRYTEKTRNALKIYLERSILVAQNFIDKEMESNQDDILKWFLGCRDLRSKNSRDNVFSRLSGLADLSAVEFTHKSGLKFNQTNFRRIFENFRITKTSVNEERGAFKTSTVEVTSWENFNPEILFHRTDTSASINSITAGYIITEKQSSRDVYIITPKSETPSFESLDQEKLLREYLTASKMYEDYEAIEVPQDFIDERAEKQKNLDLVEEQRESRSLMTEKELRELNGEILYHSFYFTSDYRGKNTAENTKRRLTITIDDVASTFSKDTTIYGTQEDIPLMESILHMVDKEYSQDYCSIIGKPDFKMIVVAKNVVKLIDSHATHIKKAIQNVEGSKISVMKQIRYYNTAREFAHIPKDNNFMYLNQFEQVDKGAYEVYGELCSYVKNNGFNNIWRNTSEGKESVQEYLTKLKDFQMFLIEETDKIKIADKSKELFNTPGLDSCDAIDIVAYAKFKALEDYIAEMKGIFRPYSSVLYSLEEECDYEAMREYIKLKGIPDYSEFLASRNEELKVSLYIQDTKE